MDPDANLEEQLSLAQSIIEGDNVDPEGHHVAPSPEDAERLAELVLALHEWIQKGGAMPAVWEP
jgi:hypothetical protein